VKVSPDVDLHILGPLGCGIQTGAGLVINQFNPKPGSSIVVFGTGAVGLSSILAAKASGCITIIAVDIVTSKLQLAEELGATHTINSTLVSNLEKAITTICSGGLDYAFDTTGNQLCINMALSVLHRGGEGAGVAVMDRVVINQWSRLFSAKTWINVIEGDSVPQLFIPRLINMYKAGIFPFDRMISLFEFQEINRAFDALRDGSAIKPVLLIN
jgi:aryl-alcohol dehydrogenase